MIDANSEKKSRYSEYESSARHSEIVEELVFHTSKSLFDVDNSKGIKGNLKNTNYPKYDPMNTINEDEKNETDEWKPKHIASIEKRG